MTRRFAFGTTVRLSLALIADLFLVSGCFASNRPVAESAVIPQPTTTVSVENRLWGDMTVYIVSGSTRYRLGVVPTLTTTTFRISGAIALPSDLQLVATSRLEGQSTQSETIAVRAGDMLALTIHAPGNVSSLVMRR